MKTKNGWATETPTKPGLYLFSCMEINDTTENLRIVQEEDGLYVLCPDLGKMPLRDYHEGLTNPKWMPA